MAGARGAWRIFFASLLTVLASGSLQAREQPFYAGEWRGSASFDDQTGQFDWCSIQADYRSGITVGFALLSDFSLVVILYNPAWALRDGAEFPLRLSVDRRWARSVSGTASAPSSVFVFLGDDVTGFDALRRGHELTIEAARDRFQFELTGTSYALAQTAKCVFANAPSGIQRDPFSLNTDPFTDTPHAPSAPAATDKTTLASFLAAAGLDAVFMTDSERAQMLPNALYGWTINSEVVGAYFEFPRAGMSAREIVAGELAGIAEACDGKFASGQHPESRVGVFVVKRFLGSCQIGTDGFSFFGTLILGSNTGALFEHLGVVGGEESAAGADEMIATAATKLLR